MTSYNYANHLSAGTYPLDGLDEGIVHGLSEQGEVCQRQLLASDLHIKKTNNQVDTSMRDGCYHVQKHLISSSPNRSKLQRMPGWEKLSKSVLQDPPIFPHVSIPDKYNCTRLFCLRSGTQ